MTNPFNSAGNKKNMNATTGNHKQHFCHNFRLPSVLGSWLGLETVLDFDQLVVLDQGEVAEPDSSDHFGSVSSMGQTEETDNRNRMSNIFSGELWVNLSLKHMNNKQKKL